MGFVDSRYSFRSLFNWLLEGSSGFYGSLLNFSYPAKKVKEKRASFVRKVTIGEVSNN
jgi:hypothetical protein